MGEACRKQKRSVTKDKSRSGHMLWTALLSWKPGYVMTSKDMTKQFSPAVSRLLDRTTESVDEIREAMESEVQNMMKLNLARDAHSTVCV